MSGSRHSYEGIEEIDRPGDIPGEARSPGMTRSRHVRPLIILGRIAVALVWLYQGAWLKLLAPSANHRAVVSHVPGMSGEIANGMMVAIGIVETLIALWVLSGRRLRGAAIVQTILLVGMNTGGLLWARSEINDPGAMITQNFVLLVLAWLLAEWGGENKNNG